MHTMTFSNVCPKCGDEDFIAIYDKGKHIGRCCLGCGWEDKE